MQMLMCVGVAVHVHGKEAGDVNFFAGSFKSFPLFLSRYAFTFILSIGLMIIGPIPGVATAAPLFPKSATVFRRSRASR